MSSTMNDGSATTYSTHLLVELESAPVFDVLVSVADHPELSGDRRALLKRWLSSSRLATSVDPVVTDVTTTTVIEEGQPLAETLVKRSTPIGTEQVDVAIDDIDLLVPALA